MVKFNPSRSPVTAPSTVSIKQLICAVLARQADYLQELRLEVEVNVEPGIAALNCDASMTRLVSDLLRDAIDRSSSHSELSISVCRTHRGIELEIADSTSDDEGLTYNAFSRCPPQALGSLSGRLRDFGSSDAWELYRTRCPQGGQAWSLVLSSRPALSRTA